MPELSEKEKAAIVVMLCAPTRLNGAWARPDPQQPADATERALAALPFSDAAKESVRRKMAAIQDRERQAFADVAEVLKAQFWDGNEPHPDGGDARAIVSALMG